MYILTKNELKQLDLLRIKNIQRLDQPDGFYLNIYLGRETVRIKFDDPKAANSTLELIAKAIESLDSRSVLNLSALNPAAEIVHDEFHNPYQIEEAIKKHRRFQELTEPLRKAAPEKASVTIPGIDILRAAYNHQHCCAGRAKDGIYVFTGDDQPIVINPMNPTVPDPVPDPKKDKSRKKR